MHKLQKAEKTAFYHLRYQNS